MIFIRFLTEQCPELDHPLNGIVTWNGLSFKDTALIKCNDGYAYSRPEYIQRQCRADGKWSGQEGFCQGNHSILGNNASKMPPGVKCPFMIILLPLAHLLALICALYMWPPGK